MVDHLSVDRDSAFSVPRGPPTEYRIGAKALIEENDRILLIRERRSDGSSFWTLPGGGIQPEESYQEGLRRELMEELRCEVTVGKPMSACTYHHSTLPSVVTVYTIFSTQVSTVPQPNIDEGVIEHAWIPIESPPRTLLDPFYSVLDSL